MGQYSFKMPDVGEGIVEVEVNEWMVSVGDRINKDQPIADVMTDKANVEITSPIEGTLISLGCEPGEMLAVGAELILVETTADEENPTDSAEPELPESGEIEVEVAVTIAEAPEISSAETLASQIQQQAEPPDVSNSTATLAKPVFPHEKAAPGKVLASPAVRRRAREAEVDLDKVSTSDSSGRVSHQDLNAHIASMSDLAIGGVRRVRTGITQIPIKGLRRAIAKQMQTSKRHIPHYSYVEEIDLTDLEKLRRHLNDNRGDNQSRLTILPFLMLAMVRAVSRFPECNAQFDEEKDLVTQYNGVHIGMATMTDTGLKVPVLRHVEAMDIWQCASEVRRLADTARDNTIARADLSGSTITLTSLGSLGGIASTPVINHPEVAIIGVNRAEDRVVVRDGEMVVRHMMNLSSSFDHRIVDGFTGASMIQHMKSLLEHPATLFM